MKSVISNNLSLKYQRFKPSGCKDLGLENLILCQRFNSFESLIQIIPESLTLNKWFKFEPEVGSTAT